MDWSPPGSSVHGISQTRILEQISISFSGESFQPRDENTSLASPALAGRFFNTVLWEKPWYLRLKKRVGVEAPCNPPGPRLTDHLQYNVSKIALEFMSFSVPGKGKQKKEELTKETFSIHSSQWWVWLLPSH